MFDPVLYILNLGVELPDLISSVLAYCSFAVPDAEYLGVIGGLGIDAFGYNHSRQVFDDKLGCARRQINVARAWPRYTVTFEIVPVVVGTSAVATDAAMTVSTAAMTSLCD